MIYDALGAGNLYLDGETAFLVYCSIVVICKFTGQMVHDLDRDTIFRAFFRNLLREVLYPTRNNHLALLQICVEGGIVLGRVGRNCCTEALESLLLAIYSKLALASLLLADGDSEFVAAVAEHNLLVALLCV